VAAAVVERASFLLHQHLREPCRCMQAERWLASEPRRMRPMPHDQSWRQSGCACYCCPR
jgi:hypothetical protein